MTVLSTKLSTQEMVDIVVVIADLKGSSTRIVFKSALLEGLVGGSVS